ncbi:N-acetylglucosamine kinase [Olleya sp. Hel_I_94]|uniref:N-acetylglucosamine kinase n=1 Tax=Olleya sp. Hel_I_94 TaxID=1250001 RepID=UPI0011AA5EAE|nr:N-acetylglucosamine kinase [Olleya sp. Hel_I_94]TVZ46417.1 N-acetylglucosamine kinase-like BadF-type ATPase [Olleya sp. Hel_I_94]|tara:strand:- start:1555 stop:2418 length:864 start_codon:yes stop_codon:yes gene_type:complete
MILVVDSGSTKCDWIAVDKNGNQLLEKIRTKGLNPAILSEKKIKKILKNSPALKDNQEIVTHVFFYGAGCGTEKPRLMLKVILQEFFPNADVLVDEDTMAAVYATINNPTEAAVVCILGTGSNCSYFDGNKIHQRVKSLGYSIMDDASGNYYGKELLRDYYYNHMPEDIRIAFADKFNLEADYIKYNLYKQPNPNAYLAQFAEFMILNKDSKYIVELIKSGIRRFAKNMILQYKEELKTVPVHFAGSIAFFCQKEIKAVADELNFKVGNFERRPIEGLVAFHTNNIK